MKITLSELEVYQAIEEYVKSRKLHVKSISFMSPVDTFTSHVMQNVTAELDCEYTSTKKTEYNGNF